MKTLYESILDDEEVLIDRAKNDINWFKILEIRLNNGLKFLKLD